MTPMTLLFGCRDSQTDHLYKVETLKLRLDGILGNVNTAYSRQPGKQKASSVYAVLKIINLFITIYCVKIQ